MRMKLLLMLATTLLFYTQATEVKKCKIKEYVITDSKGTFSDLKQACKNLEGEMASEDLKDSENAEKAKAVVKAFREKEVVNRFSFIWLGITVEDINQPSDQSTNSFVFSDGTKFDDSNFVFRWMSDTMAGGHPNYSDKDIRCTIVKDESDEVMMSTFCSGGANAHGLCKTYEKCEDENSANLFKNTLNPTSENQLLKVLNQTLNHAIDSSITTPKATVETSAKTDETTTPTNTSPIQTTDKNQYRVSYLMVPNVNFNKTCDKVCNLKLGLNGYTMITFIKSKDTNEKIRNFIRKTWGAVRYTENGRLFYVFVIGKPTSNKTFNLIEEESKRYEDILMFDGPDDYSNIPRKTLSGMQWAYENLPSSFLYSSADDDFMIDVAALDDNIMKTINTTKHLPHFPFLCIYNLVGPNVFRDPKNKYYVPVEEYAKNSWPRACLGGFYTTRVDTIAKVWKQASKENLVRMDDVWITGILRQKAGIPDSCVVKADFKAWLHTWGYRGKGIPGSINFMKNDWERFSEEINKRPHCRCS